jgi:Arc/MetJ-type ribon-helix-helix transcriptional regulator
MNTNTPSPNSGITARTASQETRPVSVLITNHQTAVLDEIAAKFRRDTGNYMSRSDMIREILSAVLPYFADWGLGASAQEGGRRLAARLHRDITNLHNHEW